MGGRSLRRGYGPDLFAPEARAERPAPAMVSAEAPWPPVCLRCGAPGVFGFGRFMREGKPRTWFCAEHKGEG